MGHSVKYELNKFDSDSFLAGLYEIEGNRAYLILGGGDITDKIVMKSPELKKSHLLVRDIDGCPCTVLKMKPRFLKALRKSGMACRMYMLINAWLTEGDIRLCFYDLWLKYHNFMAAKVNRRELNDIRVGRKHGKATKMTQDEGLVHHLTTSMTLREAAKNGIL